MKAHYLIFAGLTIIILWNMLMPGYMFALDMIPKMHYEANIDPPVSNTPFNTLLSIINIIIPSMLIQKMLLFLILFLSFTTMYALIPTKSQIPKYFGALLYGINPFVYERFIAGHINLLLAYAITPLAVIYILKFAKEPKKNTIMTTLIIALIGFINLHNLFLTLLILGAIIIAKPKRTHIIPVLKILALITLLNAFWLVPDTRMASIDAIGEEDVSAFQSTQVMNFNTALSLAGLQGFWRASYQMPQYWIALFIVVFFLSVRGCVRTKNYGFALIWIVSMIMAAGISVEQTKPIYLFLYENVFFFRGFREPQKFIGLVALVYAYLASVDIGRIKNKFVPVALLVIPFVYTFNMFFGFCGALQAQDYPRDYYEIESYLNSDMDDFNVLILPWHLYMDYSWNENKDKRLANVAQSFFSKEVISGDNMEVGNIYSSSKNPRSKYIEAMLEKNTMRMGEELIPLNVKYVLLKKEVDYEKYLSFLQKQEDITLVKNTTNILLYKNTNEVYKIYQQDSTGTIYALEYEKMLLSGYRIGVPDEKYVVFTEPYSESWMLGNSTHIQNQPVNVWEYESGRKIIPSHIYTLLAGWIISLVTFTYLILILRTS